MRKPRTNILLPTTIFVVVGLIGQAWLARKSDGTMQTGSDPASVAAHAMPIRRAPAALAEASYAPGSIRVPADHSPAVTPQQLSDDASVLVVEMCELQLMAQGTDCTLDSRQWAAFAAVVLRYQAIQHTCEALIANLKVVAPGRYQLEIPVYAKTGDELREQFSAALRAELGEPAALEVMTKLGDRLEGCFAGFGVSVQTLDVTASPAGEPSDVQIARTMRYWNSVAGGECLATRREIHFPALEDPTGDSWSALLAKVDAAHPKNGPG